MSVPLHVQPEMRLENTYLDIIDLINLLTFLKMCGIMRMDLLAWMTSLNQKLSWMALDLSNVVNVTMPAPIVEM